MWWRRKYLCDAYKVYVNVNFLLLSSMERYFPWNFYVDIFIASVCVYVCVVVAVAPAVVHYFINQREKNDESSNSNFIQGKACTFSQINYIY